MRQLVRCAVLALLSVSGACTTTRIVWRPNRAADVPDGNEVRYRDAQQRIQTTGRALGWTSGAPRVVTPLGDTIDIPPGARLEAKLRDPERHTKAGAVVGWVGGLIIMLATCHGERYCGEQNPIPPLFIIAGGVAGHFMTDYWRTVAWDGVDGSEPGAATGVGWK